MRTPSVEFSGKPHNKVPDQRAQISNATICRYFCLELNKANALARIGVS